MALRLTLQPIDVETCSDDHDGQMVLADGKLVAVLIRLSDLHNAEGGMWYLEAGFGRLSGRAPHPFVTLDAAQDWISGKFSPPARR